MRANSNTSLKIKPHHGPLSDNGNGAGAEYVDGTKVFALPGETVTVKGKVRFDADFYQAGDWIAPTITLSGLGSVSGA